MTNTIRVYDIQWYYNYEDHSDYLTKEEYDNEFNSEPTEMIVDVSPCEDDGEDWCSNEQNIEDCLSEYISNESGYYHEGYSWEWITKDNKQLTLNP